MKKYIFLLMFLFANIVALGANVDTVKCSTVISQFFTETTKNSKGKEVCKYYVIYKDDILPTNKTTYEYINLCKRHKIIPKLYVTLKKGRPQRIIKG